MNKVSTEPTLKKQKIFNLHPTEVVDFNTLVKSYQMYLLTESIRQMDIQDFMDL